MGTTDADVFFSRDKNELRLNTLYADGSLEVNTQMVLPTPPKGSTWSPNGKTLAVVDPQQGVVIIEFPSSNPTMLGEPSIRTLPNSSKLTQNLWWSPSGNFLVTHHPVEKIPGSEAPPQPNLLVREKMSYEIVASFLVPKLDRNNKTCLLQWTNDERVCVRIVQVSNKEFLLHVLPGEDLHSAPIHIISHPTEMKVEWAPIDLKRSRNLVGRLAVFCMDGRDDLKRVKDPAEIWSLDVCSPDLSVIKTSEAFVPSGERADLLWSRSGTALLAQVETDVDETGVSYYGSTRLVLMSADGKITQDLNKDASGQYLPIQAVAWSPRTDTFILIRGFQPSHVTLWSWDAEERKCVQLQTLMEKAHRNTIKWNPYGNLVMLAGFGNLAGDMDIFGLSKEDGRQMQLISSGTANCTVTAEWARNGRYILAAVLFPRMRVENGYSILDALTGKAIDGELIEELFEVSWKPTCGKDVSRGPTQLDIDTARENFAALEPEKPKKQAYRPPKGREGGGSNAVAAMMRGEMPVEQRPKRKGPIVPKASSEDSGINNATSSSDSKNAFQQGQGRQSSKDMLKEKEGGADSKADGVKFDRGKEATTAGRESAMNSSSSKTPPSTPARTSQLTEAALKDRMMNRYKTHGEKSPCPKFPWHYIDPKGNTQGPFNLDEMIQWHELGYFRPELKMRCFVDDSFTELGLLFPHPLIPFKSYPKRPVRKVENMFHGLQ